MVGDLTAYLHANNLLRYIEGYVQKVNPQKAPKVVGALLDCEAPRDFIANLILSVRWEHKRARLIGYGMSNHISIGFEMSNQIFVGFEMSNHIFWWCWQRWFVVLTGWLSTLTLLYCGAVKDCCELYTLG